MSKFEVGKTYIAHDICDWDRTLSFTVLCRNKKSLRVCVAGDERTIPFYENAYNEGGELCFLEGWRLVHSSHLQ